MEQLAVLLGVLGIVLAMRPRRHDCRCRETERELERQQAELELLRELVVFRETRRRNRRREKGLGDESEP